MTPDYNMDEQMHDQDSPRSNISHREGGGEGVLEGTVSDFSD